MQKAIVVRKTGGPEVLLLEEVPEPKEPPAGHVVLRHRCVGLNQEDIGYRNGTYLPTSMPFIPGIEGCGVVEAVGKGVPLTVGKCVAYATVQGGAYCERRLIHARHLVEVPEGIPDKVVATVFAKALTAHYLLYRTFQVRGGMVIMIQDVTSGAGHILCQWANYIGATVIGTVTSKEKVEIAKRFGCHYPLVIGQDNITAVVKQVTRGAGVPVVYDSMGKNTFLLSLACLQPLGVFVSYGESTGRIPPIDVLQFASKCIFFTRPTLLMYKGERKELILSAAEVFQRLLKGKFRAVINATFTLADIAKAHTGLENGSLIGANVIQVGN